MNLRDTNATTTLDLIRVVASQAVLLGHAIVFFGALKWLHAPSVPWMQVIGVEVFFVLSGFLIAYTLTRKTAFSEYLIDRFARIYSAYIPALAFIVAVDLIVIALGNYNQQYHDFLSLRSLLGNLAMFQTWPGVMRTSFLIVPTFGSGSPLWTLAIEWHLYILAGALFFARRSPSLLLIAIPAAVVPYAFLGLAPLGTGRGVTWLWLMGFAGYFFMPYIARCHGMVVAAVALAAFGLYGVFLIPHYEYEPQLYPLLAIGFLGLVSVAARFQAPHAGVQRAIRFVAGYSFTLYLIHHTIVYALSRVWDGSPLLGVAVACLASNALALLIALPTEMRHRAFARLLKDRLLGRCASSQRTASINAA